MINSMAVQVMKMLLHMFVRRDIVSKSSVQVGGLYLRRRATFSRSTVPCMGQLLVMDEM